MKCVRVATSTDWPLVVKWSEREEDNSLYKRGWIVTIIGRTWQSDFWQNLQFNSEPIIFIHNIQMSFLYSGVSLVSTAVSYTFIHAVSRFSFVVFFWKNKLCDTYIWCLELLISGSNTNLNMLYLKWYIWYFDYICCGYTNLNIWNSNSS